MQKTEAFESLQILEAVKLCMRVMIVEHGLRGVTRHESLTDDTVLRGVSRGGR